MDLLLDNISVCVLKIILFHVAFRIPFCFVAYISARREKIYELKKKHLIKYRGE